ncbi:DUF2252 family protein [Paenibacillus sacheonensis]|uniref:DUF2252 domain-containing protein n=1 Tax=Paenibacillus sacheonensis TaxID=742054 RepID=A0A7X4YTZ8_9BACL|nr:DUF2252 family protein [Paenibacillus sacheonensis]MBM7568599.1 uncharacterized protein (DUF2252 family) [Paenibacillus sacheonensis]NBC72505.1 DUF2252 domain-containing protein [Paenibacillus sacheonensis]
MGKSRRPANKALAIRGLTHNGSARIGDAGEAVANNGTAGKGAAGKWLSGLCLLTLSTSSVLGGFAAAPLTAAADASAGSGVLISRFFTSGNEPSCNGSSVKNYNLYKNDFVELYNPTNHAVDLSGYTLQFQNTSGGGWSSTILAGSLGGAVIQPHGYYLIKEGSPAVPSACAPAATGASDISPADATGTIDLIKNNGMLAIVSNATLLTNADPAQDANGAAVADAVAYGSASGGFAPDGSMKPYNYAVRKGINPADPTTGSSNAEHGNGFDTGNDANDWLLIGSGSATAPPTNPAGARGTDSVSYPAQVYANLDSSKPSILMSSATEIDAANNGVLINLPISAINPALTAADLTIDNLPAGLTAAAAADAAHNRIALTLGGAAASPVSADVVLSVVVKSSAAATGETENSAPISVTLKHVDVVPKVAGAVVAGMANVAMSGYDTIGSGTFAVQLTNAAHVRTNAETVPYAAGTDYTVTGLPSEFVVTAAPDTANNRVLFTVTNPSAKTVFADAPISVVIKGNAVREAGVQDSDAITGISLLRHRTDAVQSDVRKAYVETTLKQDNTFFNDPITKAYKYSVQALAHDPFTFLRGTLAVYQADLASHVLPLPEALTKFADVKTYTQGDAHIQNVGSFNDSTGTPVFGLNDYDSAGVDAFYTDLLRFVTSMYVVRSDKDTTGIVGLTDAEIRAAAKQFLDAYKEAVLGTVGNDSEKAAKLTTGSVQTYTAQTMNAVIGGKSYEAARTDQVAKWIKDTATKPDTSKYAAASEAEIAAIKSSWSAYVQQIGANAGSPLHALTADQRTDYLTIKSVVHRINQGQGSIGTDRYNVLIEGATADGADDVVLDVKEQRRDADLSMQAYQAMAVDPDAFLGTLQAMNREYLIREISPYKADYTKKTFAGAAELTQYVIDSAKAYAYMHAYSDQDSAIGGLQGSFEDAFSTRVAPQWDELENVMLNAAEDYSHQIVADYNQVKDDLIAGKLIDVATLKSVALSEGALSPAFDPSVLTYSVQVANGVSSIDVTAAATDASPAVKTKLNGSAYASGETKTLPLAEGNNQLLFAVTAQDGVTTKTYTITVNRASSTVYVPSLTPVQSITVTAAGGAASVVNGAALQLSADVLPANASDKSVAWTVTNGTGAATISSSGLLQATAAGTVTVKATARDGSNVSGTLQIAVTAPGTGTGGTDTGNGGTGGSGTNHAQPTLKDGLVDADALKSKLLQAAAGAPAVTFNDVAASDWSAKIVQAAASMGIAKGYENGSFDPSGGITRAEFAAMLVRALGLQPAASGGFADTQGHWAAVAIGALKAAGLAAGYADGTFKPDQAISRAEIAALLAKVITFGQGSSAASFSDVNGHWAAQAIQALANAGIVNGGANGTFAPNAGATRAESTAMLLRMLNVTLQLGLTL